LEDDLLIIERMLEHSVEKFKLDRIGC